MIEPIAYEVIVTTRAALPPHNPCHLSVQQSPLAFTRSGSR